MAIVFANFGGPSGGLPSAGRSAVIGETGASLVELGATGAGIAVAREFDDGWRVEALLCAPP